MESIIIVDVFEYINFFGGGFFRGGLHFQSLGTAVIRSVGMASDSQRLSKKPSAFLCRVPILMPRVEPSIFICDVAARRTATVSEENQILALRVVLSFVEIFVVDSFPSVIILKKYIIKNKNKNNREYNPTLVDEVALVLKKR